MTVASFNKFNTYTLSLGQEKHNLTSDTIMVALTNTAPTAVNAVLADIVEISYTNLSSRAFTTTSWSQTSGVAKLILADLVLTASGAVGPFRYPVLYNNTAPSKELIGWYDIGSSLTMANTDLYTLDADAVAGILTLT